MRAACFAALGIAISAAIPTADAAGAVTNGTYLPLAMVSGMFSATLHLPSALDAVIGAFPLKALADRTPVHLRPRGPGSPRRRDRGVARVDGRRGGPGATVLPLEPVRCLTASVRCG